MPAFGSNRYTVPFALKIKDEPVKGFRLSDRIVSAIDRFIGMLTRFREAGKELFDRWLFIYPFVGSTDWTHAINLADMNRFTMTWGGAVTHNANGVTLASGGEGNTNCDCGDAVKAPPEGCSDAWVYKTFGAYSRTNTAVNAWDIFAEFLEPRNGYTYYQGIIFRYGDGNCYADQCVYYKTGVSSAYNRAQAAVADSLGLTASTQRGTSTGGPYHFAYKRGVYIAGDNTGPIGMGYGDGLKLAKMRLVGAKNYSFFFSTKSEKALEGFGLPGSNAEFNIYVHDLQIALQRPAY